MKENKRFFYLIFIIFTFALASCKSYKQHYMFQIKDDSDLSYLNEATKQIEKNYIIRPYDKIEVNVYTHKGERIIDPDFELQIQQRNNNNMNNNSGKSNREFEVLPDSTIKLPMVGHVPIAGMTIDEAQTYLEELYSEYYIDPFVT